LAAALLLVLSTAATAFGQSAAVVVLRTSEMGAYKAVEAGFAAALGQGVQSIGLAEPDGKARFESARAGAKLVFAIGPDAARAAANGSNGLMLATLVPSLQAAGLPKDAPVVPMFVSATRQARTLRAVLPAAKAVGLLYDPRASKALAAECEAAAAAVGLKLERAEVTSRAEVAEAMRALVGKVDALWLVPDPTVISADTFKLLMQITLASKLPVMGFTAGMAKAGALLAMEASHEEIGRHAAEAALRVLAGQPAAIEGCDGALYLNAKVAEMVGVSLPDDVKGKAATVFQ
jgi:putative ABC transport system substrate-binding protein